MSIDRLSTLHIILFLSAESLGYDWLATTCVMGIEAEAECAEDSTQICTRGSIEFLHPWLTPKPLSNISHVNGSRRHTSVSVRLASQLLTATAFSLWGICVLCHSRHQKLYWASHPVPADSSARIRSAKSRKRHILVFNKARYIESTYSGSRTPIQLSHHLSYLAYLFLCPETYNTGLLGHTRCPYSITPNSQDLNRQGIWINNLCQECVRTRAGLPNSRLYFYHLSLHCASKMYLP